MRKYSLFIAGIFAVSLIGFGCSAKGPTAKEPTAREPTATETIAKGTTTTTTTTTPTTTETPKAEGTATAKTGPTGPALFKSSNCTTCHKVPGAVGGGAMGPDLKGVGGRFSPEKMKAKFEANGSHNERFRGTPTELHTLIAWLASLK
ncbi:MAG TPA: c-type cytochrome [Bdellovibrionota bacterium]|nr:c-type cytochrome [Bdellovibrionota bacterium]